MNNYEKDVRIDDQQLDIEWLGQAELGIKYGKIWADAKHEVRLLEREREQVRAVLIEQANSDPEKYLGPSVKATAGNIEAYYRKHTKFIEITNKLDEAIHTLDVADVAKKEISVTRKNALTALTELMTANYFAGPAEPRNLQDLRKEQRKEKVGKISKRFKTSKKEE